MVGAAYGSEPTGRRDRRLIVLAATGAAVVLGSAVLPWRADGYSDAEVLVELLADAPALAVGYAVEFLSMAATVGLMMRRATPRHWAFRAAAAGAVVALLVLVGTPLPTGNGLGMGPDGHMFDFEIPTYRTWGCYLSIAGAALTLAAASWFAGGAPRAVASGPPSRPSGSS